MYSKGNETIKCIIKKSKRGVEKIKSYWSISPVAVLVIDRLYNLNVFIPELL